MALRPIELCIDPTSPADFLRTYWETAPLLIRRSDPQRFSGLLTFPGFDQLLASGDVHHPCFRVFRDGQLVSPKEVTTQRQVGMDTDYGMADLDTIYSLCGEGATIVLQALEKSWQPLVDFCIGLEEVFGAPTQAYAYHTPAQSGGAPPHYDTHEVFVLQLEGKKRWQVWPAFSNLPLRVSEDSYDYDGVVRFSREREPLIDIELQPGDTLYIPRGFVHVAATDAVRSLHISASVMIWRWLDVFRSIGLVRLKSISEQTKLRRATSFSRRPGAPLKAEERAVLRASAQELTSDFDFDKGITLLDGDHRVARISNRRPEWKCRLRQAFQTV